ncbi:ABC transporter substrate-binding protein [Castellaniella sp.]|uniref:ABC transporter substrate-binding protein n=1 Tax=Castellaniella sp. TaxID=1955812 RepID=UPI00355FEF92
MKFNPCKISAVLGLAGALSFAALPGQAAEDKVVIGHLTDMSSSYAALDGRDGAMAIQMAIDDFGGTLNGKPIVLLSEDHQNKADIAATRARQWMDTEGLDLLIAGTNSAAGLAMGKIAEDKKRLMIANGPGTSALTNEQCSPYTIHYAWDTVALAKGTANALIKQGFKDWYFLAADYAFGEALVNDAKKVIEANGGKVVGTVKHPLGALDFSSFLLQAQSSGAEILGIANGGADMINALKMAREFGIDRSMKVASLMLFLIDVHSMGLEEAQGLLFTTSWDWSVSDEAREFGRRFYEKAQRMPTDIQAANYSATMQWLKAAQELGTTDADQIREWFRKTPLKDFYGEGYVRDDGRYVHNMYLVQVKSPSESKEPWDYVSTVAVMPGEEVFTTKEESRCKLWK